MKLNSFTINSITFECEQLQGKDPRINQIITQVNSILIDTYALQELNFAKIHPEAIATDHFLSRLAPLVQEPSIDWQKMKEHISIIFQNFFNNTDFAQFSPEGQLQWWVIAKDMHGQILGCIQFIIDPEYPKGTIKAGMFGISGAANAGIAKKLMAAIFRIMSDTDRLLVHTRITNTMQLAEYASWGFAHNSDGYWVNSVYDATQSKELQKIVG